jgi:hypothetical protein
MAKTYQVTVIQKYTAEMNFTITVKSDLDEDKISYKVEDYLSDQDIATGIDEDRIRECLKDVGEVIECSDVYEEPGNSFPAGEPYVENIEEID